MSGRSFAARPFQKLLRFLLKHRLRKALRRRVWAEYRECHGWTTDPAPPYAYYGIMLLSLASLLLLWGFSFPDTDSRTLLLVLGVASLVFSAAAFGQDLSSDRQKPFQTHSRRTRSA